MAALVATMIAASSEAKDGAPAVRALTACRAIADAAQRLACYDREVAAFDAAMKSDKVIVLDQEQVRQTRRSLFGFPLPRIKLFGDDASDKRQPAAEEIDQIESTITRIDRAGDGRVTFSIDGGASWAQADDRYVSLARVKVGSKVKISRGTFGSYFATFVGNAAVKVRRQS